MDEFKPEDELKPDASDRRPMRSRKPHRSSSAAKLPVSRQHMMMGIGILVLLLLVLGIGSALKGPDKNASAQQSADNNAASSGSGNEKSIDLTGSASMTGQQSSTTPVAGAPSGGDAANGDAGQPRDISMPAVSSTPTQAAPVETPTKQQRVTLPGDLNSALSNQQGQVDNAAQGAQGESSLPTAPATVSGGRSGSVSSGETSGNAAPVSKPQTHASKPTTHKTQQAPAVKESKPQATAASRSHSSAAGSATTGTGSASKTIPGGSYTLQLSSASRSDTLNAWAKKQNLNGYHVYKTTRNGEPWYVLISGSYATPADAKRAVASLPAEVRAQNPWVKPVSQVKKEASN